jgi:tRNA A-37 threonylcarbamoyl transferase component Bud32
MIYKHIPDDGQMPVCLKDPADAQKMEYIGGGEYGKIFKLGEERCVKFINISDTLSNLTYIDFQNEVKICRAAGELGVGPKIYDTYVCVNDANSTCYGIIYMDYVKGITLTDFLYKYYSKGNILVIRRLLEEKINKMHNAGILHSDLHTDNVMILMEGGEVKDVKIIDFGFSMFIKDYIYHRNHYQLNDTVFHFSRKYIYGEIAQMIMKKLNL